MRFESIKFLYNCKLFFYLWGQGSTLDIYHQDKGSSDKGRHSFRTPIH